MPNWTPAVKGVRSVYSTCLCEWPLICRRQLNGLCEDDLVPLTHVGSREQWRIRPPTYANVYWFTQARQSVSVCVSMCIQACVCTSKICLHVVDVCLWLFLFAEFNVHVPVCVFGLLGAGVCDWWETSLLGSDLENVSLSSRFLKNKNTKTHVDIKISCTAHFNKESGTTKLLHH